MNKKISLGLAVAMSLLMVILTICVTLLWSMQIFNAKSNNLSEREAMYAKLQEVDHLVRQNYYGDIDEDTLNDHIIAGYVAGIGDKYGMYFTARAVCGADAELRWKDGHHRHRHGDRCPAAISKSLRSIPIPLQRPAA